MGCELVCLSLNSGREQQGFMLDKSAVLFSMQNRVSQFVGNNNAEKRAIGNIFVDEDPALSF